MCLEVRLTPGDGIDFFDSNCGMKRVLAGVCQYVYKPNMLRAVQMLGCGSKTRPARPRRTSSNCTWCGLLLT